MIRTPMRRSGTLARSVPLARTTGLTAYSSPQRHARLHQVSARRARENRERTAMADRRWPDRREGTVMCSVPECPRPADDLHEILPRGRGGSITSEENTTPVCRQHNGELTGSPEWGYRLGLLKHDGLCCQGRRTCSRYAEDGAA